VARIRDGRRVHRPVRVGAPDASLTGMSGMLAVSELVDRLGVITRLDAAIGSIKKRRRGRTGGELLVGMATAQLAGQDFLVGLDRLRADTVGQALAPVPGLASTTAAGLAKRLSEAQWRAVETGISEIHTAMLGMLPAQRAARLCQTVTIDLDTTDVEVYGRKKGGVAYNYQGQRAGRPHLASWAETATVLAADLMAGDEDPRAHAPALLKRALAALPAQARGAGTKVRLRADAGYFAGELARAAHFAGIEFAIGAKRIAPLWQALAGIAEADWVDAIDMPGAQVGRREILPRLVADHHLAADPAGPLGRGRWSGLDRSALAAAAHPASRSACAAAGRAVRSDGVCLLVYPDQPGCLHPRPGRRGRALVSASHPDREHVPRQQTRRRAASPALR